MPIASSLKLHTRMVASTSHGSRFMALGRYLVRGRDAERAVNGPAERVAWVAVRHLPTADPELAAKYMQASAATNVRVEKPVYHVALAFDPADRAPPAVMRRVAERLLEDLGLAEHQAVLVAHRDRAHPHVHLMVNRVHPRSGRAWDDAWDYRRIEASLRAQELALGLRVVQGRHAPTPTLGVGEVGDVRATTSVSTAVPVRRPRELDDPDRQHYSKPKTVGREAYPERAGPGTHATKGEVRQALRTAEAALIDRARAQVAVFRQSATWDDLAGGLAAQGLRLERKGQGLVVTDGVTAVKASRVARDCALSKLEARMGVPYDAWNASPHPRPYKQHVHEPYYQPINAGRGAAGPDHTRHHAPPSRREEAPVATNVAPVLDTPETGRRRFDPDELGVLTRVLAHAERVLDDPHRVNPELARPLAELSVGARFVARRLEQYEEVLQASITAATARDAFGRARDTLEDAVVAGRNATSAEMQVRDALASVYRDPATARRELDRASAEVGLEKAADMLRRTPEIYGQLAAVSVPERRLFTTVAREDERVARAGAELAADLTIQAAASRAVAPTSEQITRLTAVMHRSEAYAVRAEAALAQMPRADELARSVARGAARLDERSFGELRAVLPVHRAELAETFRETTVQVLARESAGRFQHVREQLAERTGLNLPGADVPSPTQRAQAAALHGEATRALLDGRDLARALGAAPAADLASGTATIDGTALARGTGAGVAGERGATDLRPSPRLRAEAADKSGRLVHQAVQALTPEELQALTAAVRVGAQLAVGAAVGMANMVVKDVASLRAGVAKALAAREVER